MRKLIVSICIILTTLVSNGQVVKVLASVNDAGDVANFDLDCSVKFPTLAKGFI